MNMTNESEQKRALRRAWLAAAAEKESFGTPIVGGSKTARPQGNRQKPSKAADAKVTV
jgi:hypothetical protein